MKRFILCLILTLLLLLGGFAAFLYSGFQDVGATAKHTGVETWVLQMAKRQSVRRAARSVEVPDPAHREQILRGAGAYAAMCATCHGAPGVERSALGRGLNPIAPPPAEILELWEPAEIFWMVKNGIRMTGMPAWGESHTDGQLWEIVAFLGEMEGMTPEEYAAFVAEAAEHEHGRSAHDEPHDHSGHDHDHGHAH